MMITFVVDTLKCMSVGFFFLSFKPRRVSFKISLATPYHLSTVFNFIRIITLLTLGIICIASESSMFPLPTILVLENTRVHVGFSNGCNVLIYIETSVNKTLNLCIILRVPNVNPYNGHIWFGGSFDDL